MKLSAFALGVVLALTATQADARMHAGPNQLSAGHRLQGAIAPLDGAGSFAAPAGAYGFRKLKSAYAGPALKLRRTTGGTQDIYFLGFVPGLGAPIDVVAANTFCAATTCFLDTWYDQSGNARNLTQVTTALQPQYIADCGAGKPCARTAGSAQGMASAAFTPAAVLSLNAVGKQVRGNVTCQYILVGANQIAMHDAFDIPYLYNGTVQITGSATTGVFHAHTGVMNGAGSVLDVDGVETTGSMNAVTAAATIAFNFANTTGQCDQPEMLVWSGYALTATERATLTANQRGFWGF